MGIITSLQAQPLYNKSIKDDGGWTVLQSRGDFGNPEDYFFKGWDEYENGFGVPSKVNLH